ncbi:hypothetical protein TNCV_4597831 [Trichonephila clavipes]|nr:hypothetical protein TNCV_4597831 [Trichonephila clavipes]
MPQQSRRSAGEAGTGKERLYPLQKDHAPQSIVKKCAAEFKRECTFLKDDPLEGRPKTPAKEETIEKVHDIVDDRRVKGIERAELVEISEERLQKILHKELGMRNLCQSLDRFNRDPTDFARRLVTKDETWFYCYTPKMKQYVGGSWWFSAKENEFRSHLPKTHGQRVLGCERDPVN